MDSTEEKLERLQEELLRLVQIIDTEESGSVNQQRAKTQLIRLIMQSGTLWRENTDYYDDALQQTWLYVSNNVCEGERKYNPDRGTVTAWVNGVLRKHLRSEYSKIYRERNKRAPQILDRETGEFINPIDMLRSTSDQDLWVSNALAKIESWVTTDRRLKSIHVRDRLDVNCPTLILKRLFQKNEWKVLSSEFGLSIPALSGFYQRKCIPPLIEFGRSQEFWE